MLRFLTGGRSINTAGGRNILIPAAVPLVRQVNSEHQVFCPSHVPRTWSPWMTSQLWPCLVITFFSSQNTNITHSRPPFSTGFRYMHVLTHQVLLACLTSEWLRAQQTCLPPSELQLYLLQWSLHGCLGKEVLFWVYASLATLSPALGYYTVLLHLIIILLP